MEAHASGAKEVTIRCEDKAVLSIRGAAHLGRWLLDWSRPKASLSLWGIGGIVQECGVTRKTAYRWAARPDFPRPLRVIGGNGQVWEADAVKAWVKLARPKTGRPCKKQKGRGRR